MIAIRRSSVPDVADVGASIPVCAQCGEIIWSTREPPRVFIWYAGDPDDDPRNPALARGAITHAGCAEGFSRRVPPPS